MDLEIELDMRYSYIGAYARLRSHMYNLLSRILQSGVIPKQNFAMNSVRKLVKGPFLFHEGITVYFLDLPH
jgi:hypothetical protein